MNKSIASYLKRVLNVAWYLGAVSVGLLALLLVSSLLFETANLSAFSLEVGLAGFDVGKAKAEGSNLAMRLPVAWKSHSGEFGKIEGNLRFPVRSGWFFPFSLALVLALFLVGMWIVAELRHVVQAVCDGQPFEAANAGRIRRVGWGLIFTEVVRAGAVYFWSVSARDALASIDGAPVVDLRPVVVICGLMIMVIAEVFREGARLREEQSLTI